MSRIAELVLQLKYELKKTYDNAEIVEITVNKAAFNAIRYTTDNHYFTDCYDYKGLLKRKEIVGIPIEIIDYSSESKLK